MTTVLEVLAKPALIHWAARTAASLMLADPETSDTSHKAAGGTVWDRAADRGSLVHSFAEALSRGTVLDVQGVPEQARGYARAFLSWVAQTHLAPLFTEANVYSDRDGGSDRCFS